MSDMVVTLTCGMNWKVSVTLISSFGDNDFVEDHLGTDK